MALLSLVRPAPAPIAAVVRPGPDRIAASQAINARWEHLILRLGFLSTGVIAFHLAVLVWARSNPYVNHEFIYIAFVEYFAAFACLVLALAEIGLEKSRRLAIVIPIILVACLASAFYEEIRVFTPTYYTDTVALTHEAADVLAHGKNPFAVHGATVATDVNKKYGVPNDSTTFRTDGTALDNLMSYPAGSFLPFVAPVAAGLKDIRWVVAAVHLLIFVLLWWAAPRVLKPLAFVPLLADPYLAVDFTANGSTDALWVLPVLASAFALQRGRLDLAAVLFGLAAGTKQQPWVLAPFLAVLIWHHAADAPARQRAMSVVRFGLLSLAGFLVLNAPFMAWGMHDWLRGVLVPYREDLIPQGAGLSMLTQTGAVDLSKNFYSVATFGVWGLLVLAYAVYFKQLRHLIWVFPAIILWFNYRSLQNYFVFWIPLALPAVYAWWDAHMETEQVADA